LLEQEIEHPKLRAVKKAVLKELYASKDAKIIIFNQYRDQAVRIKEAVDSIGVSSKIFVGQMKKGETGMSQKEQQAILEEFRNGGFNCLIATSVAEEGLDIPKVDVVLFYEPIPSAIRTVQRRGRTGRLERGKVIMLVTEGTRDVAYKYAAKNKEKRMYRVLDEVKRDFKKRNGEPIAKETLASFEEKGVEKSDAGKPRILADYREKTSGVLKALLEHDVSVELRQLGVGDYQLSDRVVVEYKTVADFVDSIVDGRLLGQLRGLRSYPRPIIVIEGEEDIYSVRRMHPNAILGMLAAITVSYNIPALFTRNSKETAALLALIARKEAEKGNQEFQLHNQKPLTDQELQEFIVSSLPGVGTGLAKGLLSHFRTIRAIADATEQELAAVEKIGPKKAKAISDIFRKEYAPEK
jgi:Fanconi anemia group M protein